jgi:hypothetical protein
MLLSYVKGAASFAIPAARNSHSNLFPVSAEFSYSQFLRHFILRSRVRAPRIGETIAELGPGSSLGFGFAALISGASQYRAIDVANHFDPLTNLRVFDQMVELFRRSAMIPHDGEYVRLFPYLDDHAFPSSILSRGWMTKALAHDRIAAIRRDLAEGGRKYVKFDIFQDDGDGFEKVDWIASHSVLEHVDKLESVYGIMRDTLSDDGVMTHLIDFSSHGLTDAWNGHWAIKKPAWTLLRGRRTYLINRAPLSTHLDLLNDYGFSAAEIMLHRRVDGLLTKGFAPEFQHISSMDGSTHMAFLIHRKGQVSAGRLRRIQN